VDKYEELRERSKKFAIEVTRLVDTLPYRRSVDVLGRQVLRSASSVGANYRAACRARSKAEFISKLHIVQEEADETQYWLELLHDAGVITEQDFVRLHTEARELTAIFSRSEKTARQNQQHGR
jgi:four helix bundle protein